MTPFGVGDHCQTIGKAEVCEFRSRANGTAAGMGKVLQTSAQDLTYMIR